MGFSDWTDQFCSATFAKIFANSGTLGQPAFGHDPSLSKTWFLPLLLNSYGSKKMNGTEQIGLG